MVYNFATAVQVTRQHIVAIRVGAQGRTMAIAARTACGAVLLMVHPTLTIATWVGVVGTRITSVARALFRSAVSRIYKNFKQQKLHIEN